MKFIKQKITLNIIWKKYYPGEFILCCFFHLYVAFTFST